MFCTKCGKPMDDNARFCPQCGACVGSPAASPVKEKKPRNFRGLIIALVSVAAVLLVGVGVLLFLPTNHAEPILAGQEERQPSLRPKFLDFGTEAAAEVTPCVTPYTVAPGLSNVINADRFYLSDGQKAMLEQNMFYVTDNYDSEFFELYEFNRYSWTPNYVTVDSLMHTYHLYFSLLLNRTEKNHLSGALQELSDNMLQQSMEQYMALAGSDWEAAAYKNVVFFSVASLLQNDGANIPGYARDDAAAVTDAIVQAGGISECSVTGGFLDYSQFKPRGYYEGDEVLERYFRTMMWYGQLNFDQDDDVLNRSALLMTVAMDQTLAQWEKIYTVTTFFAGSSDDLGYYEYLPAITDAYGSIPTTQALLENDTALRTYLSSIKKMAPPAINSIPVYQFEEGDLAQMTKGFRFMGQRFSIDAAVMQQLVYRNVTENARGEQRLLPDALDVPAAMGSDMALEILTQQGDTEFENYPETMQALRETLANATEASQTNSLYASWLYTLDPVLDAKGEGWPSYMRTPVWQKRGLECFLGSYTELKHDTVLYSKQVMAEMGGGPPEELDDRGYVEPEAEVYRRFMLLSRQTAEGLAQYGYISDADEENLARLEELAEQLMVISQKELQEQPLTDAEYELIKCYGGTLEHFWEEAVREKATTTYLDSGDFPASLVTDIATDPNGQVLQIATGKPAEIVVVVPVDGQLRLASGVVYNFYQFPWPMSQRLTNSEWHMMTGEWYDPDNMPYTREDMPAKPHWTDEYWCSR